MPSQAFPFAVLATLWAIATGERCALRPVAKPAFSIDLEVFEAQSLTGQLHRDAHGVDDRLYEGTMIHRDTRLRGMLMTDGVGQVSAMQVAWANALGVYVRVDCEQQIFGYAYVSCSGNVRDLSGHMHHISRAPMATSLDLSGTNLQDDDVASLVRENPYYEELYLDRNGITDAGMAHLTMLTNLRVLSLRGNNISDAGVAHLAGLTALQNLNVEDTDVSYRGLGIVARLPNLRKLAISNVSPRGLARLRGMPRLEWLIISADARHLELAELTSLPALRGLDLTLQGLRKRDELTLGSLTALQRLSLHVTSGCGKSLAGEISKLSQLRSLALTCYLLADADMAPIATLAHLTALRIDGERVTDIGLAHLAALPQLRTLDISGLGAGVLTADGIGYLAKAAKLQTLQLGMHTITDDKPLSNACQKLATSTSQLRCYGSR